VPKSQGLLATVIAVSTLVLTATGLFVELQGDLKTIWRVRQKPGQSLASFFKNRLLSFAMVVGLGFLLLVSLVVSAVLSALAGYVDQLAPGLASIWEVVNNGVSFFVITALFAMIFKVLPDVNIAWRDVCVGAVTTSLLFTAEKFLILLYLGRSSTVSAYGGAGSLVLVLVWVYYSSQILFFGAELTRAYASMCGAGLKPKAHAEWAVPPGSTAAPIQSGEATPLRLRRERQARLLQEIEGRVERLRRAVDDRRYNPRKPFRKKKNPLSRETTAGGLES
jgi:membrane protein